MINNKHKQFIAWPTAIKLDDSVLILMIIPSETIFSSETILSDWKTFKPQNMWK